MLPAAAECDPEREEDQANVEPEAPATRVHAVVAELLPRRDVAVGVDLGDSGQARRHRVALPIPRDRLEGNELTVAARMDLAGPQGARTDKAHVAAENV